MEKDALHGKPDSPAGWHRNGDSIVRRFRFKSYMDGIRFVLEIAQRAEAMDHHPDLHVGYREVTVSCTTHDAGCVTEKDFLLAEEINGLYTSHFMTTADGE